LDVVTESCQGRTACGRESAVPEVFARVSGASFVVSADLPGYPLENISLEVVGRTMTLKGKGADRGPGVPLRLERRSGDFKVDIPLPDGLDASGISARLKDGVLEISCPLGSGTGHMAVVPERAPGIAGAAPGAEDVDQRKESK
jgi:HSP20 family molecular chaperone IbpA